jgi:cysteine desulfurase
MEIYLDNNATTRPLAAVAEAAGMCMAEGFANPSSAHLAGRAARIKVEKAREAVAALIGAPAPTDIVFTSGGTESIAQVFAIARREAERRGNKPYIIHSSVEHAAVLDAAGRAAARGATVKSVTVDSHGNLNIDALGAALAVAPAGAFVFLMLANNETGVIFDIPQAAQLCHAHGAFLHVDAVQAAGKIALSVERLGCDYLSLSAHKFHGIKGAGAIYMRRGYPCAPLIAGHQEGGLRGGTENVPGIVAMGVAAKSVLENLEIDAGRVGALRDRLEIGVKSAIPGAAINGVEARRLPNTTNIFFPRKDAATLLERLSARGVYVSAGAACSTGGQPSHVLRAMGQSEARANASLRFSLSSFTTEEEIDAALTIVTEVVATSLDVFSHG